jgi:hypothetical protein
LAALGMLAVAALLMLARRPAVLAVVALSAAFVLNAVSMHRINQEMTNIADVWAGPQLVRDAGVRPGELVVCDGHVLARFNHQREVYWRSMPIIDVLADPIPADATIVVAPWQTGDPGQDWDGTAQGWRRLAEDPVLHWAVWRRGT